MSRSNLGKWLLGIAAALFATYVTVVATRTDSAGSVLIPYPWVWWLVIGFVVFGVLGSLLSDWQRSKVELDPSVASSNPASSMSPPPSPAAGPTYINSFQGPTNVAQSSDDIQQVVGSVPTASAAKKASIRGPWTDHVGLRSSPQIRKTSRRVTWISNGAYAGELRPSARGGGFDVFDIDGVKLGSKPDEITSMEFLKHSDAHSATNAMEEILNNLIELLLEQNNLLRDVVGDDFVWRRGASLERSLVELGNQLPAARRAGEELAMRIPSQPVRQATDNFYVSWQRLLSFDEDVAMYLKDKQTPGVLESKEELYRVADGATGAIDEALATLEAERPRIGA